jgi:hypothetical protein
VKPGLHKAAAVVCKPIQQQMIPALNFGDPNRINELTCRFEHNIDVLKSVRVVSKDSETEIWNYFTDVGKIGKYELREGRGGQISRFDFSSDYSLVESEIVKIFKQTDDLLLIWASNVFPAIYINCDTFLKNWDDFYYPGSDDLFVFNFHSNWIIYFTHFEVLEATQL